MESSMRMQRFAPLSVAIAALVGAIAGNANAQIATRCAPRAELLKQLSSLYREAPVGYGVADNGALLEVLAANNGSTWTLLVTRTNGVSCVMLSGQDWQAEPPQSVAALPKDSLTH